MRLDATALTPVRYRELIDTLLTLDVFQLPSSRNASPIPQDVTVAIVFDRV
jgi:hypothetical protein